MRKSTVFAGIFVPLLPEFLKDRNCYAYICSDT